MRTVLTLLLVNLAVMDPQSLPIQNGRAETRAGLSIERAIATVGGGSDAVWLAWRVPMVRGDRDLCSTWFDGGDSIRGAFLEAGVPSTATLQAPSTGVALEAGSTLVVLLRLVDGQVERVRTVSGSCPIDAGGAKMVSLEGVSSGKSVRALDALTGTIVPGASGTRRVAESAVSAIALHADSSADAVLDRFAASDADSGLRQRAANELGALRGAHGVTILTAMITNERDRNLRRAWVSALSANPAASVGPQLLQIARTDVESSVRGEAAFRYTRRMGIAKLADALTILNADADEAVKRRVVSAIAAWPESASVPVLIDLTKSHANLVVRKEAASALSRSKDGRAMAYLESVLRDR